MNNVLVDLITKVKPMLCCLGSKLFKICGLLILTIQGLFHSIFSAASILFSLPSLDYGGPSYTSLALQGFQGCPIMSIAPAWAFRVGRSMVIFKHGVLQLATLTPMQTPVKSTFMYTVCFPCHAVHHLANSAID